MLLSWADVVGWFTDYDLLMTTYAVDAADSESNVEGAVATITFHPPADERAILMYDTPPPGYYSGQ